MFGQELWWLLSLLFSLSQSCPSSAPSDVCSQKSAVKDFDERGGKKREGHEYVREAKKRARRKSLILPSSEFTHSHSTATHPPVSIPHFFPSSPFLFIASHLLSLTLITLCTFLSHTHAHLSSQPHTPAAIRQDSASASISRVVSIWHRASRPLRHSPVPPHSALLVTRDNWGRNSKFQKRKKKKKTDCGSRSEQHTGYERMFLKLYYFTKKKEKQLL